MKIMIEYRVSNHDHELTGCNTIHTFDVYEFEKPVESYHKDRIQKMIDILIRDYIPNTAEVIRIQVD